MAPSDFSQDGERAIAVPLKVVGDYWFKIANIVHDLQPTGSFKMLSTVLGSITVTSLYLVCITLVYEMMSEMMPFSPTLPDTIMTGFQLTKLSYVCY